MEKNDDKVQFLLFGGRLNLEKENPARDKEWKMQQNVNTSNMEKN